jgi:hypothetical protein
MASVPTYQSNPYANFDPSQWSNPYSAYQNGALPWPSSYAGWPTNALGQPIQPPQGMTLNSTPAQPQAPAAQPAQPATQPGVSPGGSAWALAQAMNPTTAQGNNSGTINAVQLYNQMTGGGNSPAAPAAAAPAAPSPSGPNNWQQALAMLAHPGQVTTPGATVPQSASSAQPGQGVLQQFLNNWRPAQSGPGSGYAQSFNNILRGLQGSGS